MENIARCQGLSEQENSAISLYVFRFDSGLSPSRSLSRVREANYYCLTSWTLLFVSRYPFYRNVPAFFNLRSSFYTDTFFLGTLLCFEIISAFDFDLNHVPPDNNGDGWRKFFSVRC